MKVFAYFCVSVNAQFKYLKALGIAKAMLKNISYFYFSYTFVEDLK